MLEHETEIVPQIPLEDVRNFCFIAHVDHGKSSLSSRVLELTGNLGTREQQLAYQWAEQGSSFDISVGAIETATTNSEPIEEVQTKERINLLDTLAVEQQRGITVKASTATMLYRHPSAKGPTGMLLLNMYDTPGHVDFGREVSRSLSFVQGAVLLLDASQGIQAQTWSVYDKVQAIQPVPPKLIIALTKIDMPSARPEHVALQVADWLQYEDPDAILYTSSRNRIGIKNVLDAVCAQVPPPTPLSDDVDDSEYLLPASAKQKKGILRAQVVDSWYDSRGVNCLVQVVAGHLEEGDRIAIANASAQNASTSYSVQEVGIMLPHPRRSGSLRRGQMGYVRFGLRDPRQALPGTILIPQSHMNKKDLVLPAVSADAMTSKSVLYASVHPSDSDSFEELCNAVDRLALNDTGLEVTRTSSVGSNTSGGPFLGPGLRVGFQGLLHVEVFRQRLQDEFQIDAVVTPPKVPYRITWLASGKRSTLKEDVTKIVEDLSDWVRCRTITKSMIAKTMTHSRVVVSYSAGTGRKSASGRAHGRLPHNCPCGGCRCRDGTDAPQTRLGNCQETH
jgi:translation elongation factor EF-4